MHASAAEAGDFARRVESGYRLAIVAQHSAREIGLESTEGLARKNRETHRDEWTRLRVQQSMRPGDANQLVADVLACTAERRDLGVAVDAHGIVRVRRDEVALHTSRGIQDERLQRVAPLRESAVVLISAWGVLRLREGGEGREGALRIAGSALVLVGAVALGAAR